MRNIILCILSKCSERESSNKENISSLEVLSLYKGEYSYVEGMVFLCGALDSSTNSKLLVLRCWTVVYWRGQ